MPALRTMSMVEFARRLKRDHDETRRTEKKFAFFLGAGCSVSSGVPAAGALVKDHWLPRLYKLQTGAGAGDIDAWAKSNLKSYDPNNPAAAYGEVITKLFLTDDDRQSEIERLCDGKQPGFGYATLAQLVALDRGMFNVVLTTNFDDLVSDAMYLYTDARPLVIQHESLAAFIRPTRMRPLVVKVHGDHRLAPKNTLEETTQIEDQLNQHIQGLLQDRGLIFIGYGGNDAGIAKMLRSLPARALPAGVYWLNKDEPKGAIRSWLDSVASNTVWVEAGDFDLFMLHVFDKFEFKHPGDERFKRIFLDYAKRYEELSSAIRKEPAATEEGEELKRVVDRTDKSFSNWFAVELEAQKYKKSDSDQADKIYRDGIEKFPQSHELLGNYALFLEEVRKDYDQAEAYFKRALEADPNSAVKLGNYAIFLKNVRKDYDQAEAHYKRALESDPNSANILGNYAIFLSDVRKDHDQAEAHYKRALEADPNRANSLGNFAGLVFARGRTGEGLDLLDRAIQQAEKDDLRTELWFYLLAHGPLERRGEALAELAKLLGAGARSPNWPFDDNIARAREDGHPDSEWLQKLADVINEKAELSTLDAWPAWREAVGREGK